MINQEAEKADMTSMAWLEQPTEAHPNVAAKRRRVRGLRLTSVPSWPLLAQVGGGASVLSGVYLQWGVAVTLIVGGALAAGIGMLREGGKI